MHRRALLRFAKTSPFCRPGVPRFPHPLPVQLAHVAEWFYAASDTTRLAILELLSQRTRCASEIQDFLGASQSNVSFHLRVLRESGLVRERRDGRRKYYSLEGETLNCMVAITRIVSPGMHRGTCPLTCCQ